MTAKKSLKTLFAVAAIAVAGAACANPPAGSGAAPAASAQPAQPNYIGIDRAVAAAEKHHPGGKVTDVDMDFEMGRTVYEIELKMPDWREYDVKVDAVTGKVIHSRMDW